MISVTTRTYWGLAVPLLSWSWAKYRLGGFTFLPSDSVHAQGCCGIRGRPFFSELPITKFWAVGGCWTIIPEWETVFHTTLLAPDQPWPDPASKRSWMIKVPSKLQLSYNWPLAIEQIIISVKELWECGIMTYWVYLHHFMWGPISPDRPTAVHWWTTLGPQTLPL